MSAPDRPDRAAALAQYRSRAASYDWELAAFEPIRREAVARLRLEPGQTVLDIGCGTGLSFAALAAGVGPDGRVVGVDQSAEMLAVADRRIADLGLGACVRTLRAPAEEARLPAQADAALFMFTHDVLRRPEAVTHVLAHLRPGARIVAVGLQWAGAWAAPANLLVWGAALRSLTTLEGLDAPWSHLVPRTRGLRVEPRLFGMVYLLDATARGSDA